MPALIKALRRKGTVRRREQSHAGLDARVGTQLHLDANVNAGTQRVEQALATLDMPFAYDTGQQWTAHVYGDHSAISGYAAYQRHNTPGSYHFYDLHNGIGGEAGPSQCERTASGRSNSYIYYTQQPPRIPLNV